MDFRLSGLFVLLISLASQAENISIEQFSSDRDMPVAEKILLDNYSTLTYEAMGYPEGTTKKYLNSPRYTTKVLRVEDQTAGFINYVVVEPPFLLKWFMTKKGLIHLMGVDMDCKRKGYGQILLMHALEDLKSRGLKTATLAVKAENIAARRLYEKEGFNCSLPKESEKYFKDLFYNKNL